MSKKFATAINCMDGRAQQPVTEYMIEKYGVDHVDMITEPGPNKILAENTETGIIGSMKKRVEISVEKHHSNIIAIVGHYDCAGNPSDENTQKEHLNKAVNVILSWGFSVEKVVALWLDEEFKPRMQGGIE